VITQETRDYLFVYGTLRSDSGSDSYRRMIAPHFSPVGRGTAAGRLYAVADYPGLRPALEPTDVVIGEVFSFTGDESQLAALDDYEGCASDSPRPHLYYRTRQAVVLDDGTAVTAWVYFYNHPVCESTLIRSGDFLDR